MPVASENKDSLDILSLASDSALIVAKPSVDMDLGDQEKQQEPTAINLTDLAALVKHELNVVFPPPLLFAPETNPPSSSSTGTIPFLHPHSSLPKASV